jgi:UPF0042 nucleotide-binding protein
MADVMHAPPSDEPRAAAATAEAPQRVVMVTGLSGAGLSTALAVLEDLGYEAVDNLPLFLLEPLMTKADLRNRPLAVGIDGRTRDFTAERLLGEIHTLEKTAGRRIALVFVDCSDDVLARRFVETRRRHPLAADRPVRDGIARERALLEPLRGHADVMIDTTELATFQLRQLLAANFALQAQPDLQIFVTSFAYRRGIPREADLVFDVRFLRNPHYVEELRPLTGTDGAVAAYIENDPEFPRFFAHLTALLEPLLPRYRLEGKTYLTIAVGCTGGRHRSVFVAEKLAAWLRAHKRAVALSHSALPEPIAG